ncbi:MAG: transglutaminase domain-containing protein [Muribaculaceae bacterium]
MRHLRFIYRAVTQFSVPVTWHYLKLRCRPCSNACQRLTSHRLIISPEAVITRGTDCWGNAMHYGSIVEPHSSLSYESRGTVFTHHYAIPVAAGEAIGAFKVQSALTAISPAMDEFRRAVPAVSDCVDYAAALAHALHSHIAYTPLSTHNATSAAEAFAQQSGVCQDYSHILIAMCRASGMAARYVAGLIPGEGATHAWVEVLDEAHGVWRAIDPTNDLVVADHGYIKLAHGRDVGDCPVNRGSFRGAAMQSTQIAVSVEDM